MLQALRRFYRMATWLSPRLAARLALLLFITPSRSAPTPAQRAVLRRAERIRMRYGFHWLQVYRWGGSGPTVLLAHGWSSRAARLAPFVEPFVQAGFQVIAFDAPGHGASSGIHSDVMLYRQALRLVLERLAPIHAIVGHSLGARAAMVLLASSPCRDVRALALVAMPPDVRYMFEEFQLALDLRADVRALLVQQFERLFGAPPEEHCAERHASCVSAPVLVLHDCDDDVAPVTHAEAVARQLRHATLVLTRRLNHCGVLADSQSIAAVVGFIARHCNGVTAPTESRSLRAPLSFAARDPAVTPAPEGFIA
jgi:pimeloyl-ACP methyl ester carboxylesterase